MVLLSCSCVSRNDSISSCCNSLHCSAADNLSSLFFNFSNNSSIWSCWEKQKLTEQLNVTLTFGNNYTQKWNQFLWVLMISGFTAFSVVVQQYQSSWQMCWEIQKLERKPITHLWAECTLPHMTTVQPILIMASEVMWPSWESNSWPLDLQSHMLPIVQWCLAYFHVCFTSAKHRKQTACKNK